MVLLERGVQLLLAPVEADPSAPDVRDDEVLPTLLYASPTRLQVVCKKLGRRYMIKSSFH